MEMVDELPSIVIMDWIIVWFSISEKSESKQYCWCKDCRCTFCLLFFFFKSFILHEGKLTPQTIAGFQGNSEEAIFLTCTITANTYVFFNILACSHECPPVWENSGKSTGVYWVSPCSCSSSQFSTFILSLDILCVSCWCTQFTGGSCFVLSLCLFINLKCPPNFQRYN